MSARLAPPDELVPVDDLVIELPDNELSRRFVDALRAADQAARAAEAVA